jgi:membrane protein
VGALVRTLREYKNDNLTDWAAALTYYSVLSIFPAMLLLVALLGVFGNPNTVTTLLDIVKELGPASAVDTFKGPIESVVENQGGAAALAGIGTLGALWSASGYVGAFMRASDHIYEVDQRRFFRQRPMQLLITLLMVVLLVIVVAALVLTGPLAEAVGKVVGLSSVAVTVWSIAKWPVLLLLVIFMISLLYYLAPNVRQPKFRFLSAGGALALLVWIVASIGFGFYVANFASYNQTYGSLGAVIVFLVWLYISNNALLLGAEFNAELERSRELEEGLPAEERLQVEPRDAR